MTAGYQMLIAGRWVDSFGVRLLMDAGDPYSILYVEITLEADSVCNGWWTTQKGRDGGYEKGFEQDVQAALRRGGRCIGGPGEAQRPACQEPPQDGVPG